MLPGSRRRNKSSKRRGNAGQLKLARFWQGGHSRTFWLPGEHGEHGERQARACRWVDRMEGVRRRGRKGNHKDAKDSKRKKRRGERRGLSKRKLAGSSVGCGGLTSPSRHVSAPIGALCCGADHFPYPIRVHSNSPCAIFQYGNARPTRPVPPARRSPHPSIPIMRP